MGPFRLIIDPHGTSHHHHGFPGPGRTWNRFLLIDSQKVDPPTGRPDFLQNRAGPLRRLMLNDQNIRHAKTIRTSSVFRNPLSKNPPNKPEEWRRLSLGLGCVL